MRSDSGKAASFINNTDVRGEFEKIFRNPDTLSYWRNYIQGRLKTSIISKYERHTTGDDILSQLKMKIYGGSLGWDRNVYRDFKHFMYGKIQNIIRNKEKSLSIRYEQYLIEEEARENGYDAKPTLYPVCTEDYVEVNPDRIGKPLNDGEDMHAYYNNFPKKWFDKEKFKADSRELLSDVRFTDLLAIFNGLMEGKTRREIMEEYGFTGNEYHNLYRRLLYKLRGELPREYEEIFLQ
jgi:hypothetical protein